jgi:Leucine-rich repeat (LRR) protein
MNDRECLVTLFDAWGGKAWWRCKDHWKSEEGIGKWYGVQRDAGGHCLGLSLTDNTVTGELGDATIKWLPVMVNLKSLYLMKNSLRGSVPHHLFQHLKSLEELNLAWNQLEGILPDSIWELSKLRILRLDNNRLSGVVDKKLGQLSQLKQLNLSRNEFSGQYSELSSLFSFSPAIISLFLQVRSLEWAIS